VVLFGYASDGLQQGQQGVACLWVGLASTALLLVYIQVTHWMLPINVLLMTSFGATSAGLDAALAATAAQDVSRDSGLGIAVVGTATGIIVGMGSVGAVLQGWLATEVTRLFGWGGLFHVLTLLCLACTCALVPHAVNQAQNAWHLKEAAQQHELEELTAVDPLSGQSMSLAPEERRGGPRSRSFYYAASGVMLVLTAISWMIHDHEVHGEVPHEVHHRVHHETHSGFTPVRPMGRLSPVIGPDMNIYPTAKETLALKTPQTVSKLGVEKGQNTEADETQITAKNATPGGDTPTIQAKAQQLTPPPGVDHTLEQHQTAELVVEVEESKSPISDVEVPLV